MAAGHRVPERAAGPKKRQRRIERLRCSFKALCRQDLTLAVDANGRRYPVCTGHLGEFVTSALASIGPDAVVTVRWREMPEAEPAPTQIRCPDCGWVSHNPNDIVQGYCGNCHDFTSPPNGRRI